jgi:hypothetical protein
MFVYLLVAVFGFWLGWWVRPQPSLPDVIWVLRIAKRLERGMSRRFPGVKAEGLSAYVRFLPQDPSLRKAFLGVVRTRNRLVHTQGLETLDPENRRKLRKQIRLLQQHGLLEER